VRRLVAALPFQHGILVNWRGKTEYIPFPFKVMSAEQTNVFPKAKLPEKESGDESPHSMEKDSPPCVMAPGLTLQTGS
jgi:hypothetical protein